MAVGVRLRGRGKTLPLFLAWFWFVIVLIGFLGYMFYLDPVLFGVMCLVLSGVALSVWATIIIADWWVEHGA